MSHITQVLDISAFRKLQNLRRCFITIRRCKPAATHSQAARGGVPQGRHATQPLTAPGCVTPPIQTSLTFSFRIDLLWVCIFPPSSTTSSTLRFPACHLTTFLRPLFPWPYILYSRFQHPSACSRILHPASTIFLSIFRILLSNFYRLFH